MKIKDEEEERRDITPTKDKNTRRNADQTIEERHTKRKKGKVRKTGNE